MAAERVDTLARLAITRKADRAGNPTLRPGYKVQASVEETDGVKSVRPGWLNDLRHIQH